MVPTEEEKQKIQEAQLANPDVPLGSAEQFLLSLSSISDLTARLQLWAFKLDYESLEQVQSPAPHLPSDGPAVPSTEPSTRELLSSGEEQSYPNIGGAILAGDGLQVLKARRGLD